MSDFYDTFGYRPWATSAEDAAAKMDDAEQAITAQVVDLSDERSPLVDAQATAGLALQALHGPGHPSPYVRMSEHLKALEAALTACQRAAEQLREQRQRWGMASLDASSWRKLERRERV